MNRTIIRRSLIAAAATAAVTAALTACGDTSGSAPATTTSNGPAAPGKSTSNVSVVSVDGKTLSGAFQTTCAKQGGVLALSITDAANATYGNLAASATITGADTVQAVGITGSKGGSAGLPYAVGFGNGQPGGSARVDKDGNTYRVTGEGVAAPDPANPLAGVKTSTFDLTFACSTIVGG
ncbi:lipoprotein LpqH [Nocardia sp. NPDC004068]|uniref:lipoprotein LpqH n=1 Tax=Nocardia sp. NPDC004068 TaxID=3364303 RepID=UPI0036B3880F